MASQSFERVSHHSDEAEVLRGGMLASYGLTKEAGEIFSHLIERGATPTVRDRAWFYLAKIRYQRGYLIEAEEALAHVENHLPAELQEERALLLANLLMARSDFAGAAATLSPLVGKTFILGRTTGPGYARYNLGIALLRSGEPKRGAELLDQIGKESAQGEELRSLRDRANVALGFSALADNRPKDARGYLQRVRLQGLQANKALLGFGWAADAMKDPKLALVPWTELAKRTDGDNAVLEAQIAVPYAYAELGAYNQALQGYETAIASFERENADLAESIKALRSGNLIDSLVDQNPGDEMGWFWSIRELPTMPHARHLAQVLAQNDFQEALKNYRDLRYLSKNLDEWRDKLVVFDDMLATRRKAFADRLPQTVERSQQLSVEALTKRRDALAAQIAEAETDADGLALADDKELELLNRLKDMKKAVDDPVASAEVSALRERVRLVSGVLGWQLSQSFSSRSLDRAAGTQGGRCRHRRRRRARQGADDRPARRADPLRALRPAHRRDPPVAAGDDPARGRPRPRAARRSPGRRHRRADQPAATDRFLHDAGALRARPALRPRQRQGRREAARQARRSAGRRLGTAACSVRQAVARRALPCARASSAPPAR